MTTLSLCEPETSLTSRLDSTIDDNGLPLTNTALTNTAKTVKTAKNGCAYSTSTADDDLDAVVSAAVAGERPAVEEVLRRIRPLVVRYCRSRVGAQERTVASADDVAQEVCIAVLTALPSYRDQGRPFLAFVYGIAAHKVSDTRRSSARNRAEPVADVPDTLDLADGPEAQVVQGEFAGQMAKLLDTLSDKQRDILRLRVVVGLSVEETAKIVGSTPGGVRVAQHRALNRLRTVMAPKPTADYGVRARVRSTSVTSKITGHLGRLTELPAKDLHPEDLHPEDLQHEGLQHEGPVCEAAR